MTKRKLLKIIPISLIILVIIYFVYMEVLWRIRIPYKQVEVNQIENLTGQFDIQSTSYDRAGWVYHMIKSDQNDRYKCEEWIYYPTASRSESFKIYPMAKAQKALDLVCADYNYETFMPDNISAYLIRKDGTREKNSVVYYYKDSFKDTYREKECINKIGCIPSYYYNFDWADLITMIPYLKDKQKDFEAGFICPTYSVIDQLIKGNINTVYSGKTHFMYIGQENYNNCLCNIYKVEVEGFENKLGKIYIDANNYDLIEINMRLSDNPSYNSFKFILIDKKQISLNEWNEFITKKVNEVLN